MKNIIVLLLISIIPLLTNAQDSKAFIETDSIQLQKQSFYLNNSIENLNNDTIRYNMIKIAGFFSTNFGDGAFIFSLGYERRINTHFSSELIWCVSAVGMDVTTDVSSIRLGIKYYFDNKNSVYSSAFLRYQHILYNSDEPKTDPNYDIQAYGIGSMLGCMLKFSRVIKLDLGFGLFYSYRVPTDNRADNHPVIGKNIYMIPRVHLSFCF